ncbi:MAG: helix-turn-helix domain-containing protein [Verrucomicrobia bacterium]|nr:helix-turn-helix domain-containing protein [Verrucomicrobiota bacterium]
MNNKFKNLCGGCLRSLRLSGPVRVTQEQLVQRLFNMGFNIDRTAISRIENQQRPVTDIEFVAICVALGVDHSKAIAHRDIMLYFNRLLETTELKVAET